MFRELLQRVRAECRGARAHEAVRQVARFHRIQSSPGYDAAADWLAGELEGSSLDVRVESVPGDGRTRCLGQLMPEGWTALGARAWLHDGSRRAPFADFAAEPLSLVQRSAPVRGRFRLVAVADGSEPAHYEGVDVRGAVVLVGAPVRRAFELAVKERGAVGLVCDWRRLSPPVRTAEHDLDSLAYTSFWWGGSEPRGWGFVATPRAGAELRQRLAAGERLELEVEIDSRRFDTSIPLVSAHLRGTSDEDVLVLSHLCHPFPGAHDNGSGVAANLETARAVAALARDALPLRRGVRFLWMPELTGTFGWLAEHEAELVRLTAALNLDMVGADQAQCGSTFLLEHPPCFAASFAEELLGAIRAEALDWTTSFSGPGHYSQMRLAEVPYSGGSDHAAFVDPTIGVPCPMLIHWPDRYYHSSYDTPDRVDPAALELTARCAATYALFLAGAEAAEIDWLASLVARGARRRLLAAADRADAGRAVSRERIRGAAAIASLSRLGVAPEHVEYQRREFAAFADREIPATAATTATIEAPRDARVPRRLKRGPLDFIDHLNPGWDRLDATGRDAWRALRRRCADPALELAWFAADGRRTVDQVTALVALETGPLAAAGVGELFDFTARMGISAWDEAPESGHPEVARAAAKS